MEEDVNGLMMSCISDIAQANNVAISFPNAGLSKNGEDIDKDDVASYWKVEVFPTEPEPLFVCSGCSKHLWLLQISVYTRDGIGAAEALRHIDIIRGRLPITTKLEGDNTYTVVSTGQVIPSVKMEGWYAIPVQFKIQIIT